MKHVNSSECDSLIHEAHQCHLQGNVDRAEALCRIVQKVQPLNFDALQILGAIALGRLNYPRAVKFLTAASDIHDDIPGLNVNLGIAYKHNHQFEQAKAYFERAIELDPNFGQAYYNLALVLAEERNFPASIQLLRDSERCRPEHVPTLKLLASTLQQLGHFTEAEGYYHRVLQLTAPSAELYFSLGLTQQSNKAYLDAVSSYTMAIEFNPERIDIQAKLADVLESISRSDEARVQAEAVLAREPSQPIANLVLSRIERRAGNLTAARDILQTLSLRTPPNDVDATILSELGMIQDRLGEYPAAFSAFTQANDIMASQPEVQIINPLQALQLVESCRLWLNSFSSAPIQIHDALSDPVFLVGFPRSGTTLTEQILASHTNVVTGDEQPVLHNMAVSIGAILGRDLEYPACLDKLTAEDVHQLRKYYWSQMVVVEGESILNSLFIDKMPLNIIHLGFIERIFPTAKIIVALRDPRDVCLSCFMQMFTLNESMMQFFSLKKAAAYYAAVMGLWLGYREKLSLSWIESRYEDIVTDLGAATLRLNNFLGLDTTSAQAKFYKQAANRAISTPSYQDVSTPIYDRAKGRWKHYADQMAPVLSTLAPYIDVFGYEVD